MWIVGLLMLLAAGGCAAGYAAKKGRGAAMETTATATVEHLEELARSMREGVGAGQLSYATEVKGQIECPRPLASELAAAECIHYRMKVQRQYEETYFEEDEDGNRVQRTRSGRETVAENRRSVPFFVNDGTGGIRVDPSGAEWVAEKILSRFEPAADGTGSVPTIGTYSLPPAIDPPGSRRRTVGYQFEEEAISIGRRVYVLGEASDREGELAVMSPRGGGRFVISVKGEDELRRQARSAATGLLAGAVVLALAGLALIAYHWLR